MINQLEQSKPQTESTLTLVRCVRCLYFSVNTRFGELENVHLRKSRLKRQREERSNVYEQFLLHFHIKVNIVSCKLGSYFNIIGAVFGINYYEK